MALTETNVDSKAPRKVKIIWLHQEIKDVYLFQEVFILK